MNMEEFFRNIAIFYVSLFVLIFIMGFIVNLKRSRKGD